jgi:hypothetical protein
MELFIFLLHMDPPPVFGGLRVAHLFIFVRCVVCMCVGFFLSCVLFVQLAISFTVASSAKVSIL